MSYYAKINQNNVVEVVIAAEENFIKTQEGKWVQTSYNTRNGVHYEPNSDIPSVDQSKALRKNYAGIGYTYDPELDAFIPPCPEYSNHTVVPAEDWQVNPQTALWELKVPHPGDFYKYDWDTVNKEWINKTESEHYDYSTNPPTYI